MRNILVKIDTDDISNLSLLTGLGADILTYTINDSMHKANYVKVIQENFDGIHFKYKEKLSLRISFDIYGFDAITQLLSIEGPEYIEVFYHNIAHATGNLKKVITSLRCGIFGFEANDDGDPYAWLTSMFTDIADFAATFYQIHLGSDYLVDPWKLFTQDIIESDGLAYTEDRVAYIPEGLYLSELRDLADQYPIMIASSFFDKKTITKFIDVAPNLLGFSIMFDSMQCSSIDEKVKKVADLIASLKNQSMSDSLSISALPCTLDRIPGTPYLIRKGRSNKWRGWPEW